MLVPHFSKYLPNSNNTSDLMVFSELTDKSL